MTNYDSLEVLDRANDLGLQIAEIDFIKRYRQIEQQVTEHGRIQQLLEQLKRSRHEEYQATYDELMAIPLFSEYIDLQKDVESYLKDVISILVKSVSPKISLDEKQQGGCGGCHGCQ